MKHDEIQTDRKDEHQLNMRFQEQRVHNKTQANKSPLESNLLDKKQPGRAEKNYRVEE